MHSNVDLEKYCRVCGYEPPAPPYGPDGTTPSFDICPCCGVEWGYEDFTPIGVKKYRDSWLADGAPWCYKKQPMDGLTTADRLARIGVKLAS